MHIQAPCLCTKPGRCKLKSKMSHWCYLCLVECTQQSTHVGRSRASLKQTRKKHEQIIGLENWAKSPESLSSFHWHFWGVTLGALLGSYYVSPGNGFGQVFPPSVLLTRSKGTEHEFTSQSPSQRHFPEVQPILKHQYITTDLTAGFYPSKNKT